MMGNQMDEWMNEWIKIDSFFFLNIKHPLQTYGIIKISCPSSSSSSSSSSTVNMAMVMMMMMMIDRIFHSFNSFLLLIMIIIIIIIDLWYNRFRSKVEIEATMMMMMMMMEKNVSLVHEIFFLVLFCFSWMEPNTEIQN